RRQLVDQQLPAGRYEKLHAENSDHVQLLENSTRDLDGAGSNLRVYVRVTDAEIKNVVAMGILNHSPVGKRAIDSSRSNDRYFALEVHEFLIDSFDIRPIRDNRLGLLQCVDFGLAFAVITKRCCFDDGGEPQVSDRPLEVFL